MYCTMCTYHILNVFQLIEDHEFDSDKGVIIGANIFDVALELCRKVVQLGELRRPWDEAARIGGV